MARDLTGEEARVLIDDILARTKDDFLMHFGWKTRGTTGKIEQHLSFHGSWSAQEILATSKGRNEQIEEIILRSMRAGDQGAS
jgi:hypothetical protein